MSAKKIGEITVVHVRFQEEIANLSEEGLYQQMIITCRLNRKRLIPKSVSWDSFRALRGQNWAGVELLRENKLVFRFGFAPAFV